jgi:UDP-N-acetylmuramate--alanine ligase
MLSMITRIASPLLNHILQLSVILSILAGHESTADLKLFTDLPSGCKVFTYGLDLNADYRAINLKLNQKGGFSFDVVFSAKSTHLVSVSLQIPGEHNVRNSLGVIGILHQLGTDLNLAAQALSEFTGTGRRFDIVGEVNGITIVDDYAHHPSKIRATLSAARSVYPGRRIVAVWQPHTYTRTRTLAPEFITSFSDADEVIVSEIYASREKVESYSSRELVNKMCQPKSRYIATIPEISDFLVDHLVKNDVLIVLSAGDADQICKNVFNRLSERKG